MNNIKTYCSSAMILITLFVVSGCGKPGGGASADVQVQPKSSDLSIFKKKPKKVGGTEKASGGGNTEESGTFSGRIVIAGNPKDYGVVVSKGETVPDAAICSANAIPNETLLVGKENGIANVFIYLEEDPRDSDDEKPPTETVSFVNVGCQFKPHALIVRTGQKIHVTNVDPVKHNTSTAPEFNDSINKLLESHDSVGLSLVYEQQEPKPVLVKCTIHSWMKAYHLPLDHPFVALTDKDGKFEIKNLPSGKYKFKIWHESNGFIETRYKVTIQGDVKKTIEVSADKLALSGSSSSKVVYLSLPH
ncbi:hypothetical protein MNBD_PLANCTO02-1842 [hydrothermal vent metagenome]|uniref:Rhamnogalacturonan lyase domain-containing protein n=1 Tax=hydrothermal vent metagenome TaxID=652676 RepID=A0A3B1DZG8_9ZZZZ